MNETARVREVTALETEVARLRALVVERDNELGRSLAQLAATADPEDADIAYRRRVQQLRRLVSTQLPEESCATVVSGGDEALLQHAACRAEHLSQGPSGCYAGRTPDSGRSAIAQLEAARSRGAGTLVIPASNEWWLVHYPDFLRYLERQYVLLAAEEQIGSMWDLRAASPLRELDDLLTDLRLQGREAVILDWQTGHDLGALFDECTVFAPESSGAVLPYLDASIDVVAVAGPEPELLGEARRVAAAAVVTLAGSKEQPSVDVTRCSQPGNGRAPRVSVVVASRERRLPAPAYLRQVEETLPCGLESEVVLPLTRVGRGSATSERVQIVRCRESDSFRRRLRRAAEAAAGDLIVVLGSELWPVRGWLPPLAQLLRERSEAVVTGLITTPDGRVAPGRAPWSDGNVAASDDPGAVCHGYVRRVAAAPAELFGMHRELLLEYARRPVRRSRHIASAHAAVVTGVDLTVLSQPETLAVAPWPEGRPSPDGGGEHR